MPTKYQYCLLVAMCGTLLVGCDAGPSKAMSKEDHRELFFDSVKPEMIIDYQFYYSPARGGYITFARLALSTNADSSFLQGYTEKTSAENISEQTLLAETLHYRAVSLLANSNSLPAWLECDKGSLDSYYEKKVKSNEWNLWWDKKQNKVYFVGVVNGSVPHHHTFN